MYGSSGCLGVNVKTQSTGSLNRESRKQSSRKRISQGPKIPHKYWWTSSSSDEMESNGGGNPWSSQRSQNPNCENGDAVNNTNDTVFVNDALALWNENRREWVGRHPRERSQEPRDSVISWTTTYEDLLASSRPFPQPIPLPEMVDFLVDVWLQEGLYD